MALTFFGGRPPASIIAQLSESGSSSDSDRFEGFPVARWRGRCFIEDQRLWKKGSRLPKAWIKDHGVFLREINQGRVQPGRLWVCRRCDEKLSIDAIYTVEATSSASSHLEEKHKIVPPNKQVDSSESKVSFHPSKRPRYAQVSQVRELQELLVGHIVNADLPFGIYTERYITEVFNRFDPSLASQIPWSRSSQRRQLETIYEQKRASVKASLKTAASRIHLVFDLWTSSNNYAVMAVSCHFLDSKGIQQQRLLALTRQSGAHTGNNLATTLLGIMKEWEIQDCVGTLVSDNASSNDVCTAAFFRQIKPAFTKTDIMERRMRCYGHILNLRGPVGKLRNIVKFIRSSPQRSESFKALAQETDDQEDWLLHEESKAELQLTLSNDTRWNSTYLMIDRAIKKKNHIHSFLVQLQVSEGEGHGIPVEEFLTAEDWRLLTELKAIVEPLYFQTMRCQGWGEKGSFGYLWEILPGMEFLLDKLEFWKVFFDEPADEAITQSQSHPPHAVQRSEHTRNNRSSRVRSPAFNTRALPPHVQEEFFERPPSVSARLNTLSDDSRGYLRLSITNAWQKLNQYYTKLGESPLFAAAVILHPGRSLRWLETRWNSGDQLAWLRDAKDGLEGYWTAWYRDQAESGSSPCPASRQQKGRVEREDGEYGQWLGADLIRLRNRALDATELERYLRLELPIEVDNPITWWMGRRQQFPTLSTLALDIFSIPAMAADCERAFSLAKLTLTSQRLAMDLKTLQMVQCLKNWVRRDAVTLGGVYFKLAVSADEAADL
ncbi:hypothetical protein CHGG_02043 [Chaetomium globosum CBS 148.51]|uniref:HAT C-terminal dimerisation domain-containing protein n=1 Tax=Chaetomium globosum (strain ATCC 6205 / CBS 148.51 / DSM 1962 / NBRC 6347 / NRRL 1970) TaxID=306901 RepID=Q2HCL1_CHAGB|nr:uncharacterized protein CHGG_02043 [Chaetomium globosum CBS 148.51]EAQ93808.1 hypothetical protein CHGG_02043 [Chaetomium globosum CBS 148.51]